MNKKTVLAFVGGLLVPIVLAVLFLVSGGMPVATKGPPLPGERKIAGIALHAAMGDQSGAKAPMEADEVTLRAGAKVYVTNCAVCHGVPQGEASFIAKGLFPKPPQLFPPNDGVTDDPVGEIYWKVKNGIRLTGMPGFVDQLSESEMWQVSLLLLHADKLPDTVTTALKTANH